MTHLLPILWAEPPTTDDWARLRAAKEALGYADMVKPARALQGSPGRILAVGVRPDWLCEYNYTPSTEDAGLADVLGWCLGLREDPWAPTYEDMLSDWFKGPVVFLGEEPYGEE
jgi:hypothetical protein